MTASSERSQVRGPEPELEGHEELGRAFKGAMAAVRRLRGRETHRPGVVSNAQYGLLFGLALGGEMSARELAESADLTPATVTQMLDALEAAGLVARLRSEQDRRVVLVSLTEHGLKLVEEHRARVEPRWRAALAEFSDDELRTAAAVLRRVAHHFNQLEDRN